MIAVLCYGILVAEFQCHKVLSKKHLKRTTDRQKDSKTDRQRERQTERKTKRLKDRQTERQKDRKTEGQKDLQQYVKKSVKKGKFPNEL